MSGQQDGAGAAQIVLGLATLIAVIVAIAATAGIIVDAGMMQDAAASWLSAILFLIMSEVAGSLSTTSTPVLNR